ncbi:hypothetical protein [Streptomyces candidus]|uniref:Uncharacterized protein n=1 Tax=Streptomyces candidus TaxID=67283 RepID=A0A7X0HKL1_9ACTN|nr:hypothetical protein [Streptomyces candidus]MBB6439412.1 hypothetical protein [Streptomyces candidus]GHH54841.1 hypothetical protein GCM10018773_58450 [Streptomyces candidus]
MIPTRRKLTVAGDAQVEAADLGEIRVLYSCILSARSIPARSDINQSLLDMETAYEALITEIDGTDVHQILHPRYESAVREGRALIEAMEVAEYADVWPADKHQRAKTRAAFQQAHQMAEQVKALTEVLSVQRRERINRHCGGPTP